MEKLVGWSWRMFQRAQKVESSELLTVGSKVEKNTRGFFFLAKDKQKIENLHDDE